LEIVQRVVDIAFSLVAPQRFLLLRRWLVRPEPLGVWFAKNDIRELRTFRNSSRNAVPLIGV
jgi:hypothetical protein